MKYIYCAVTVRGWAYSPDIITAICDAFKCSCVTPKTAELYGLRVFMFEEDHCPERWELFCPVWKSPKGRSFWLIYDNLKDWDGELPKEMSC